MRMKQISTCVLVLMTMAWVSPLDAQVRGARRRAVVKREEGKERWWARAAPRSRPRRATPQRAVAARW
jgi:hypothetical protein